MTERIGISIITGFLGSGKTTLINALLPLPEMANSAVLVNEFGQISIDNDLIESADEDVLQLSNGCVCCALNEELGPTLVEFAKKRAAEQRPVERMIIETTGMANAGPIVEIILEDPEVRRLYALDKVITTVDAINGDTNLNLHAESVEQVAVADRLLLTKLDALNASDREETTTGLLNRLRQLNPNAPILTGEKSDAIRDDPDEQSVQPTPKMDVDAKDHGARHDHHIKSLSLVSDKPKPMEFLKRFLRDLNEEAGPNLLRVKGLVCVEGKPETPAVVQGVRQVFDAPRWLDRWPSEDRTTRIVVIGWMLDQPKIERMFEAGG